MPTIINAFAYPALTDTQTSPSINVGTLVNLDDGGQAVYVKAASEVSQYAAVAVLADNSAVMLTTTNAATSKRVGFAQVSIASGSYGWVQTGGVPVVKLAASCLPNVPLFTTATAGTLDDATVSGNGVGLVVGIVATATASGATAITCVAGYPHVSGAGGAV